jgi:hypothetical protein
VSKRVAGVSRFLADKPDDETSPDERKVPQA